MISLQAPAVDGACASVSGSSSGADTVWAQVYTAPCLLFACGCSVLAGALQLHGVAAWAGALPAGQAALLALAALYLLAELVFWAYMSAHHVPRCYDARRPILPPVPVLLRDYDVFVRHAFKYVDARSLLSTWFCGAPFDRVRRGNAADLVAYGFLYTSVEALQGAGQGPLVEAMVDRLEDLGGIKLPPGRDDGLRLMSHLWEPLRYLHMPLAGHAVLELAGAVNHAALLAMGFRHHRVDSLSYYTHGLPPPSAEQQQQQQQQTPPRHKGRHHRNLQHQHQQEFGTTLFLHGVGLGLLPYLGLLWRLRRAGQRVLAPEFRHASMRLVRHVPCANQLLLLVTRALDAHGVARAGVMAHSYGTFIATRLLREAPHRVAAASLLDPVCFAMFSGKLLHSFVYAPPRTVSQLLTWAVSRSPAIAATFCRQLLWTQTNLWPHELPPACRTLVALGGADALVPSDVVLRMVAAAVPPQQQQQQQHNQPAASCGAPTAQLLYQPGEAHASLLYRLRWQREIVERHVLMMKAAAASAAANTATKLSEQEAAAAKNDSKCGGGRGGHDADEAFAVLLQAAAMAVGKAAV